MGTKEKRFINNNEIDIDQIIYITRDGRKSVIHMNDGTTYNTFHTIKGLLEVLPAERFACINKGIVISARYIKEVNDNNYIMMDGAIFKGRAHSAKNKLIAEQKEQAQINQSQINRLQIKQLEIEQQIKKSQNYQTICQNFCGEKIGKHIKFLMNFHYHFA